MRAFFRRKGSWRIWVAVIAIALGWGGAGQEPAKAEDTVVLTTCLLSYEVPPAVPECVEQCLGTIPPPATCRQCVCTYWNGTLVTFVCVP